MYSRKKACIVIGSQERLWIVDERTKTHPFGPVSLLGLLGGLVGGGQQGPPRREGQQCPGEALECGRALEGDMHKEIFYAPP